MARQAVEAPRQPKKHFDQIQALTRVNPAAHACLAALCTRPGAHAPPGRQRQRRASAPYQNNSKKIKPRRQFPPQIITPPIRPPSPPPGVDVVVLSGSEKEKLEEVFDGLPLWLAAENGLLLRPPGAKARAGAGGWPPPPRPPPDCASHGSISTVVQAPPQPPPSGLPQEWVAVQELAGGEWKESVQLVFEYFCERTPRSFVEQRGTSLVWNYKHADVEFGRIQVRKGRAWSLGASRRGL